MKNSETDHIFPESIHWLRTLATGWRTVWRAGWRWLIETAATLSEPERRRSNALTILILVVIFSAGLFFVFLHIFISAEDYRHGIYGLMLGGLLGLFSLAGGLNRSGHYSAAAGLIVACMVVGPWAAVLLNFASLDSDIMRLAFITPSVLMCSFLLSARVTIILAVLQLGALWLVSLASPVLIGTNWPSLLSFFGFISLLSIISNLINSRDLAQIDRQTCQLLEREEQLRELSIRDPLTGLFNRRYLDETLEREVQRAARTHSPLGIIIVDADYFKSFNDTLGHAAGDALLQKLGKLLNQQVRFADIACRYGGEEFVLVMPDASLNVTKARAEVIREKVKRLHLFDNHQGPGAITISLGVAVFPDHGATGEAILKSADVALYRAKREGRDRVVVADTRTCDRVDMGYDTRSTNCNLTPALALAKTTGE